MKSDVRSYSTQAVAKRLGISLQTVQRWVDSGRLKAWKTPGGHRRIDARSADLLFEDNERKLGADASTATADGPAPRPLEVVIVDDDPLDREMMATLVQL